MNVREEDRQKNNCPSRGLGLAAAAIGVGVGAALYYFFSQRPENPDGEGSTSGWACERPHALTEEEQMAILRNQALYEEEQLKMLREQSFRERTWSLEECSICFDIILKDQQVTTLPCTHHFHAACVAPWLQEQRTCPNCRKAA